MKVLLINNFFCHHGGAENSTYMTGTTLREHGHEVYFFATDRQPYIEQNYEYSKYFPRFIDFSSISKTELFKHILNPFYFYNFEAEKNLDAYLKEIKPDIVHCNNITYFLSPSILKACKKNNVPIVLTVRDAFLSCPDVGLVLGSKTCCKDTLCISKNPLQCIYNRCNDGSLLKSTVCTAEFLLRRVHKLYDNVSIFICTSKATYNLMLKSGYKEEKLVLVNNFIDNSFFKIKPEFKNRGYFLYAGRLGKEKGIHYLIEAMTKVPKNIKLHIAGNGPDEEYFKTLAKNFGLNNIEFIGKKTKQEIHEEYKNCIAAILPCNFFETFGLTVVEAFSYGKPVIGSNIGGIPEIIDNGINGLTFDPENVDELASGIIQLYNNNDMVVEMGKKGRIKAEKLYTPEVYYSNLINVYNSLIK